MESKKIRNTIIWSSASVLMAILITLAILIPLVIVPGCAKSNLDAKVIDESRSALNKLSVTAEVTDKEVLVYKTQKTTELLADNKATITTTKWTLDADANLVEKSESSTEEVKREDVLAVNMMKSAMIDFKKSKHGLTFKVKAENLARFFMVDSIKGCGDGNFVIKLANNKMTELTCLFNLSSGKVVKIIINCEY